MLTGLGLLHQYAHIAPYAPTGTVAWAGRTVERILEVSTFPNISDQAERLAALATPLGDAEAVELLCGDCPFYHPEREEQLECGSFRILKRLLERGELTPAQIVAACR